MVCVFAAASCSHSPDRKLERIALLPVNLLLPPGHDADWTRAAVPLILQRDLASDSSLYLFTAADSSAAYAGRATEELQVTMDGVDKRHLQVDLRNLSTQEASAFTVGSAYSVISSLNQLAKRLSPKAEAFAGSEPTLHLYVEALAKPDPHERIAELKQVTLADSAFGLAYLSLIEAELQAGSPDLPETVARAKARESTFAPSDRARLDLLLARFPRSSLSILAEKAEAVINVVPHDLEALAVLGEVRFLQGNAQAGQRALLTAAELSPADSRLREQLAQGFLETRDFARAELLWKEMNGSSGASVNQAIAVLLAGDRSRASTVLDGGLQANPLAPLIRAQWGAIGDADVNGGPQRGRSLLQSGLPSSGDVAAFATMQSAIWFLQLGDRKEAQSYGAQALQKFTDPAAKQTAQAVALIVDAGSAAALQSRLEAAHADRATKNVVLGYGLFLYGDYSAAAEQWRELIASSGDTDLRSRAMLASCLRRSGKDSAAFGVVVEPFVPNLSGTDPFATIAFNEMRQLLKL